MKKYNLILLVFSVLSLNTFAQCINMANLNDPSILCTYGTVLHYTDGTTSGSPYDNVGVIDFGSNSKLSRHTIHTYVNERDANVYALKTIPDGENSSIRLGNWDVNYEAESITFTYMVTSENPLLLLKYASVMENPVGHEAPEQPRVKLEVRDEKNAPIDSMCNFFDFIASPTLGWNTIPQGDGTNLLWKDWTNIGVNLEDYVGRTVRIRLTNYDCGQGAHYGYAYIHLSCAEQKIETVSCGDDVYMEAPSGYEYKWFKKNNPNKVVGTTQTIVVPADGSEYSCQCHQIGRPMCYFIITQTAAAAPRYPIADFSIYKEQGCADTLYLTNLSGISSNGVDKNVPIERCDSAVWILDDGRQFTQYDISFIPIVFANTGEHTITLTTFLHKGECHSTITKKVYVHGTSDPHALHYTEEICEGDYYFYDGRRLVHDSLYTFVHPTTYGCDSMVYLRLIVHPRYLVTDTIYLCDGDTIDYHGERITSGGTYVVNNKTTQGCDSIYKAVVLREKSFYLERDTAICDGEIYDFGGRLLQHSGVYWDSARTISGCDSITKLTLRVKPSYLMSSYVEVCHDQSFLFRGRELDAPGIYYDTLLTHQGCDSIFELVFNKTPIYMFQDTVTICEGSYYNFRGRNLYEEGMYYDSLLSIRGCDSVYQLLLKVEPMFLQKIDTVICGNVYDFRGRPLTTSGIYHDTVKTYYGCDSIYELNLVLYPTYLYEDYIEQCEGDMFWFRNRLIDKPGVYYDSLFTQDGCDSIYKLVYNVAPTYMFERNDTICSNKAYRFRDMYLTYPGVYYDTVVTSSGCDSIFKLTLHHYPSYETYTKKVASCGDIVLFKGDTIQTSGVYTDSLQTTCGCDSVYTLDIQLNKTYLFEEKVKICDHEVYIHRGKEITKSGIYIDSLTTHVGCDSIYVIEVEIVETIRDTLMDTICIGDVYEFYTLQLNNAGFYSDTLLDPMGERCEIHSIRLETKPSTTITNMQIPAICADEKVYMMQLHYYGTRPHSYSIYYDKDALNKGFINVVDAPYSDTIYAPLPQYENGDYVIPDYYHARIELRNGFCSPDKMGYNYDILVRYPSWIIRQHWHDVVAVLNSAKNGGYQFEKYEWEVNGRILTTTSLDYSNLYMPELRIGDIVCAYLTREGENYAIPTCPIVIQDKSNQITNDNPILIYPTAISKLQPSINIVSSIESNFSVYDIYGKLVAFGTVDKGVQQISLPSISGVYLIVVHASEQWATTKILVR